MSRHWRATTTTNALNRPDCNDMDTTLSHPLDNPFWSSLASRHHGISVRSGRAARFPPDCAPFLGVADSGRVADVELEALVGSNETVYLLGVAPEISGAWQLEIDQPLTQMICLSQSDREDGTDIIELGPAHREDALALTALVYPHFFRSRTMDLGRYFGIYRDGRLAAMIGERLGTDDYQEISAVCTHPDYTRQGHAQRLLGMLTNDNLRRERIPFLHASLQNSGAISLYERIGYSHRRNIAFWSLRRRLAGV